MKLPKNLDFGDKVVIDSPALSKKRVGKLFAINGSGKAFISFPSGRPRVEAVPLESLKKYESDVDSNPGADAAVTVCTLLAGM